MFQQPSLLLQQSETFENVFRPNQQQRGRTSSQEGEGLRLPGPGRPRTMLQNRDTQGKLIFTCFMDYSGIPGFS